MFFWLSGFPGKVVQNIFGKCTEALYCGDGLSSRLIWRPCTLPEDNAVFYGFSRFAVELNEVSSNERGLLPPTDARFRPDQRCLEVSRKNFATCAMLRFFFSIFGP